MGQVCANTSKGTVISVVGAELGVGKDSARLESLFPSVLWKSCKQIPLAFKARFPGVPTEPRSQCLHSRLISACQPLDKYLAAT